ncbi:MAG: class IV adenylate cyclase [Thermoplasmatota archaeon]
MYEVEAKVAVASFADIRARLASLGATSLGQCVEKDVFFQHPHRDFRETDEALRLRDRNGALELTYKGPNESATLKSRIEHNVLVTDDPTNLLSALGFKAAAEIEKDRESWQWGDVLVMLDALACGRFVEVEAIGEDCGEAEVRVAEAMRILGLEGPTIRESYLRLLERHRAG